MLIVKLDPAFLDILQTSPGYTVLPSGEKQIKRKQAATNLMLMQWRYENWTMTTARIIISIMYLAGFIVLAIPTLEMFLKVVEAFFQ